MRRTWYTSASPAIGIIVAGTGQIGFTPPCASAATLCVAAPASASAPDASMVLRSTEFMKFSLRCISCWCAYLDRPAHGPQVNAGARLARKKPARTRAFRKCASRSLVLDVRRDVAAGGGELPHLLLVQPDIHGRRIIGVAGVAEFLGKFLARTEA